MIVAMKKAVVITQTQDKLPALARLRSLGVFHVQHAQLPKGKDINTLLEAISQVSQALSILPQQPGTSADAPKVDWEFTARHIVDLYKRKDQLAQYLQKLSLTIQQYEEWGDFDPKDFQELARKNIFAGLYQLPIEALSELPRDIVVAKIAVKNKIVNCLLLAQKKIEIGFKEIPLPQMSLADMYKRRELDSQAILDISRQIEDQAYCRKALQEARVNLQKELEFQEALAGEAEEEIFSYISGFIPADSADNLIRQAKKEQWALRIDDPSPQDNVPVLLRNPAWVAIISPVFKFLEILPGYRELDSSLCFLIFFSIFFGILIGDAGYGLLYFVITFFFHRNALKSHKKTSGFFLFYILSFCAIIWGLCTGAFFGQEWLLKAGYKPLIPALNDEKTMQALCFLIGAVHLSIAHIWRAVLKCPALNALADIGWICVLWVCFFTAKLLILGQAFPPFGVWLLAFGLALVVLFTDPQKNILKGIASGLGTVALSLMNNFTDVVSYIRLFAVGLAGIAIADAFNSMAHSVGRANVFSLILAVLILLVGHTLGAVLGPVSVLVHGIRLNVLEFSGHAHISWSGQNYKPLKE